MLSIGLHMSNPKLLYWKAKLVRKSNNIHRVVKMKITIILHMRGEDQYKLVNINTKSHSLNNIKLYIDNYRLLSYQVNWLRKI